VEVTVKKREDRRDRTWRKGARRRRDHLRLVHPNGVVDCVCELSVWRFAKRRALGCDCRSRTRGNPKVGNGLCARGDGKYRPAVTQRIAGRRAVRHWIAAADVEDVDD
jgi:hypothetical protein